jgi:1,4-alpha-glucan branching enzyme
MKDHKATTEKTKAVNFQLVAPEAKAVTLAGEFNNWDSTAHPLKKGKDGVWKVAVRLKPGSYQYKFVVDGEGREDQEDPKRVLNPQGTFNSVCEVL